MKSWVIFAQNGHYGVACGECAEKPSDSVELITPCVIDQALYSVNCDLCHKNAGDYFHRKELAA